MLIRNTLVAVGGAAFITLAPCPITIDLRNIDCQKLLVQCFLAKSELPLQTHATQAPFLANASGTQTQQVFALNPAFFQL